LYKRKQNGEKLGDLFEYLNAMDQAGTVECKFNTAAQIANIDNAFEILKNLALFIFKSTNERFNAS